MKNTHLCNILFIAPVLLCSAHSVFGQDTTAAKGKFSGEMYFDYFYNIEQMDSSKKDLQGFQLRRVYFTYDYAIARNFDTRLRLEVDQNTLTSNNKIGEFVKEAFLQWKNIFPGSDLITGLSATPTWFVSEDAWGYRSLEKTIMDFHGISVRTDLGVDLKGKITHDGVVNYFLKIGNNSGQSPETDKFKRYYGMLHFKFTPSVQATAYADFDAEDKTLDAYDGLSKNNHRILFAGFINYHEEANYSLGLEGFYRIMQNNYQPSAAYPLQNQNVYGVSAFGWVSAGDNVRLIGRFDVYDPNTSADKDGSSYFLTAVDYMPVKEVHVMPNFYVQSFQADVASDVVARMTFYYTFK